MELKALTQGEIITFYSYKGGTGRSMALANVACILAKQQQELAEKGGSGNARPVLMIDWDLDAPGLHRYFRGYLHSSFPQARDLDEVVDQYPGLIDFFSEVDERISHEIADNGVEQRLSEEQVSVLLREITLDRFVLATDLSYLHLMKAGQFDAAYSRKVRGFNWENLYNQAEGIFPLWSDLLTQNYSHILIDSRTGITDMGDVCTMLMPEKLVAVFTPNHQSLGGLPDLVRRAIDFRGRSDDERPLIVFPLPSRIEQAEQELQNIWRFGDRKQNTPGYQKTFEDLFDQVYPELFATPDRCDLRAYFSEVQVQHVPHYAYGEEIAVLVERTGASRLSLSRSYKKFTEILQREGPWSEKYEKPETQPKEILEIEALSAKSSLLRQSGDMLGALLAGYKAARAIKQVPPYIAVPRDIEYRVLTRLERVLRGIKECNRFEGHGDNIRDVSFSSDGRFLVTASQDRTLKIWALDGTLLSSLDEHKDQVRDVSFSSAGNCIASASDDRTVILWQSDGTFLRTLEGHQDQVLGVCFGADGKKVISSSADRTIKVWNLEGDLLFTLEGHKDRVHDVSYNSEKEIIASASDDGTVKLWRLDDGQLLHTLQAECRFFSVSFSHDGQLVAASGTENVIRVWNVADGEPYKVLEGHQERVVSVTFSHRGRRIASASEDGKIKLWQLGSDELEPLIDTFEGHKSEVQCVRFSPKDQLLASGGVDTTVRIWTLDRAENSPVEGLTSVLSLTMLDSVSQPQIISADSEHNVKLWDSQGNFVRFFKGGHEEGWVTSVCVQPQPNDSAQERVIASGGHDGQIILWSRKGRKIRSWSHESKVQVVTFSTDGTRLASAGADTLIKLWDLEGNLLHRFEGHTDWVLDVKFSPDGKFMASASSDGTIRLWNVESENHSILGGSRQNDWVYEVSFDPSGTKLAVAVGKLIQLWNLETAEKIHEFRDHTDKVYSVCFSPDGDTIASGSHDGTVKLWSLKEAPLKDLKDHTGPVRCVQFSADGKWILSGSSDRTIKIWDTTLTLEDDQSPLVTIPKTERPNLDTLMSQACSWLDDYLRTNPSLTASERQLCNSVLSDLDD